MASAKIKFTKDQLLDVVCRTCCYPDNPKECPVIRRGDTPSNCGKCIAISRAACRRTSLENESIFENY